MVGFPTVRQYRRPRRADGPPAERPRRTTMTTKQIDALLARHAKLREAHSKAFAAVETSDAPTDSTEAKRLAKRRDAAYARLAPVAAKLREQGYTLTHDDSTPVPR